MFASERPIRATRHLKLVSGWLAEAASQLDCAAAGLRKTADRAAESPELALHAPEKLIAATRQWIDAAGQLTAFSEQFNDTFAWLRDSVKDGTLPIPLVEQTAYPEKSVVTFRLVAPPLLPPDRFPEESSNVPCIPVRRQRSVCSTVAEAARRVFRGRAPPLVSTCSL
jgi:hypothetical protein